ncbi:MAG: PAS domain-containing sensor histidine kinase [Cyclobacteriaceae bacterium]
MFYRRFTFLVIIRVILLVANIVTLALIFGDGRLFFNQIILFSVFVFQVIELIRFVNHTNRDLARLFLAVRHSDFSVTFKEPGLGRSFKALQDSMIEVVQAFKDVKIEKEAQFHFLQALVNQVQVGIISIEANHSITIINALAESLAGIKGVRNWKLIHQLNPAFAKQIEEIGDNGRKLIEFTTGSDKRILAVDVKTLSILDKPHKLITFQDINSEIEQKEIEAWNKLIRILTHEIMNSVTPVSSLTETMQSMLQDKQGHALAAKDVSDETITDLIFSIQTIHRRSEGLLNFVEDYRKVTKVPKPEIELTSVNDLLHRVQKLMTEELQRHQISLNVFVKNRIEVELDPKLIEQVLINLVTNAMHALDGKSNGRIEMLAFELGDKVMIDVKDNGRGIPEKEIQQIFIPFFSTKKTGSGIGLSLSKQIMRLHDGSIRVNSKVGGGTTFTLAFPKHPVG